MVLNTRNLVVEKKKHCTLNIDISIEFPQNVCLVLKDIILEGTRQTLCKHSVTCKKPRIIIRIL
jgi:hypothetical protein